MYTLNGMHIFYLSTLVHKEFIHVLKLIFANRYFLQMIIELTWIKYYIENEYMLYKGAQLQNNSK